jgi:hypothetical protein
MFCALALLAVGCGGDDDDGSLFGGGDTTDGTGIGDGETTLPAGDPEGQPSGDGYTAAVEANFIQSCEASGGVAEGCRCIWDELVRTMPYEDFVAFEEAVIADPSTPNPPAVQSAFSTCQL